MAVRTAELPQDPLETVRSARLGGELSTDSADDVRLRPVRWIVVRVTVADGQCGVLTVAQALASMTRAEVRARVDADRWQRPHHGVLVTHNGPLTPDQEMWVCLLAAPPGSALGGPTAARLEGLRGFESAKTWIVVPYGQRRLKRDGVVALWSTHLGPEDVHALRRPRRTCIERSVLDMSINASSTGVARAPLLAAVQQGVTVPDRLREALARRGRCAHHALIEETIADAEGGIHSLPEKEFEQILRRRGLPQPTRQRVVRRHDGRYYLDADWDGLALSAESTAYRTSRCGTGMPTSTGTTSSRWTAGASCSSPRTPCATCRPASEARLNADSAAAGSRDSQSHAGSVGRFHARWFRSNVMSSGRR